MALATSGLVSEWVAKLADGGTSPGENTTPDATWKDLVGSNNASLANYAWTTASGWDGTGTTGDPYRLDNNGTTTSTAVADTGNTTIGGGWSAITLEAWVILPATLSGTFPRIIDKSDVGTTGFALYIQSSAGNAIGTLKASGASLYDSGLSTTDLRGATSHLVMTYDDADDLIRFYLNGVATGGTKSVTGGGTVSVGTSPLCIGNRKNASTYDRPMDGGICTVRIYNRAISSTEAADNYAAGILASTLDGAATVDRSCLLARGFGIA